MNWFHVRRPHFFDFFVPDVEIQQESEAADRPGYWHQRFILTDPADKSNPRPVDIVGPKLDLHDPRVLAEQWRKFGKEPSGGDTD